MLHNAITSPEYIPAWANRFSGAECGPALSATAESKLLPAQLQYIALARVPMRVDHAESHLSTSGPRSARLQWRSTALVTPDGSENHLAERDAEPGSHHFARTSWRERQCLTQAHRSRRGVAVGVS